MKIRKITALVTSSLLVFIPLLAGFLYTAPTPVYAADSPSLGQADSFAVLAGTTITNVPTSAVTGDVGLSPGGGAAIGITCSQVTGTIYDNDAGYAGGGTCLVTNAGLLTQAKTDLVSAYDALSAGNNATCTTDYGAITQDLVGLSLTPGVYCADAFTLSGTLTLSGSGVWVFRSASTLITSGTANVVGGDACNVWWKVASSATLGTTTQLTGNILALTTITMATGANLSGRALARNAAVNLDSNTITKPTCTPTPTPTTTTTTSTNTTTTTSSTTDAPVYVCPTITTGVVPPNIIDSRRVNATSIFLGWGPYSGTDRFNIRYGPSNGDWLFNTDVTGFSTTINNLPSNTPMWFQVAARNDCQIGEYGGASLIGGTSSVGFPNTGVPRFPNTGLAPKTNNSWLYPLAGLIFGVSVILISIQRKS